MAASRRRISRYQPDPLLREGPRSTSWSWLMGGIVLAAIVLTLFALSGGSQNTAQHQGPNQPATTGAAISSQSAAPAPGNAAAPPETQGTTQR